nr:MAG TPA: hypothetical protein [Caudoviricetes sp.]
MTLLKLEIVSKLCRNISCDTFCYTFVTLL